jgi:hypothetical protein
MASQPTAKDLTVRLNSHQSKLPARANRITTLQSIIRLLITTLKGHSENLEQALTIRNYFPF